MRLTDVDELLKYIPAEEPLSRWALKNAPTVEAIPIEWLHSIMERQLIFALSSEMEGTTYEKDGIIHCVSGALACQVLVNVITLWEKENGKE